ncbi:MAG: zinc-dependent metalloprotease [Betaproteobacteria bacterium]|nr:zinc-dependent metalloprotease [Betaproteobacteria bacterium]
MLSVLYSPVRGRHLARRLLAAAVLCLATPLLAQNGPPPAVAAGSGAPSATAPSATAPKAFKDVVKDATEKPGFFPVFQKDDKVWLELAPEMLERPFYFSYSHTQGIGEKGIYGGRMGRGYVVHLHKVGNQVQLLAENHRFRATPGSATARAIAEGFSESLLASATVASLPHPERKSVLVEANNLFLTDLPGSATQLESAFRVAYAFDARNSSIQRAHATPEITTLEVKAHYTVAKLPAPPASPLPAAASAPTPPHNLPDARSMFLGYHYSLMRLPETAMPPRLADERLGHFTTTFWDWSNDLKPSARVHYVNRWRLEKKDPAAALSEPKQPIVFWLDRNIPEKYRAAVKAGVLEWNKAFEKIGFKDAVQAELQGEKADFHTASARHASIRWYLGTDLGPAVGPSNMDPRTGEILDADIRMTDVFTRGSRRFVVEEAPRALTAEACHFAEHAADEAEFTLELLEARAELNPDSPEADRFVNDYVKEVIMHEVGHTLGLRHNFRASTIFTAEQLRDPEFVRKNGTAGSVMDYTPFNIPVQGEAASEYIQTTLGPYDYWAIEYAYKPIAPEQERTELARIAARSTEPWLAYGTDEDSSLGGAPQGMDPTVNVFDLGADPLAFYQRRLRISRELWGRLQKRELAAGEDYGVLRRNLEAGFRALGRAVGPASKFIGGVVALRDRAGTGRRPYTPVSAERQREALKLIAGGVLSVDSFHFSPEFMSRLTFNRLDYTDTLYRGERTPNPEYSLADQVLSLQRSVLDQLLSEVIAARLSENELKLGGGPEVFRLSELYAATQAAIWSELEGAKEISPLRRNVQREYTRRLAGSLIKPSSTAPADVRPLQRESAKRLVARLKSSLAKGKLSVETRAHLAETMETLEEALQAPMQRSAA